MDSKYLFFDVTHSEVDNAYDSNKSHSSMHPATTHLPVPPPTPWLELHPSTTPLQSRPRPPAGTRGDRYLRENIIHFKTFLTDVQKFP